jgi:heme-degrading monooxygenase HmoA
MFVRATSFRTTSESLEEFLARYQERIAPLTQQPGYAGNALLVDRSAGTGVAISYWESAEARQASEDLADRARSQASAAGSQVEEIWRGELVISERVGQPKAGVFARANRLQGSPDKIDELIALMRDQGLPILRTQTGFRGLIAAVNRETGQATATSIWETAADREASDAAVKDTRQQAGRVTGAETVSVNLYEVAFVDIKQPAHA